MIEEQAARPRARSASRSRVSSGTRSAHRRDVPQRELRELRLVRRYETADPALYGEADIKEPREYNRCAASSTASARATAPPSTTTSSLAKQSRGRCTPKITSGSAATRRSAKATTESNSATATAATAVTRRGSGADLNVRRQPHPAEGSPVDQAAAGRRRTRTHRRSGATPTRARQKSPRRRHITSAAHRQQSRNGNRDSGVAFPENGVDLRLGRLLVRLLAVRTETRPTRKTPDAATSTSTGNTPPR